MNFTENQKEMYILAQNVAKNINGRKLVLWGDNGQLRHILKEEFNLDVEFIVTVIPAYVNGDRVRMLDEIKGKSDKYYLIAWGSNYEKRHYDLLNEYGYVEIDDFIYRRIKPIILEEWDCANGRYEDAYGNIIESKSAGTIRKIVFRGYNNRITIGAAVSDVHNLEFDLCANEKIDICDGCKFGGITRFDIAGFDGTASVYIDRNSHFLDSVFKMYNDVNESRVLINENCTFGTNLHMHANTGKKIIIGRDCMFSNNIHLQSGDGHSLFDVKTGKNINSLFDKNDSKKNQIFLGDHIWVASNVFMLNGTNIGTGSVVGADCTVKGIYPNNCAIAGNPAKKVRDDIAWSRDNSCNDINRCGRKEYVAMTQHSNPTISGKNVLVIGGTRFMGVQLVKELLMRGNTVTIATRGNVKDRFGDRIKRIVLDLQDAESVKKALDGKEYDVVFDNLAYCSNFVKNVLSFVKCKRYIQLSSVEVYCPTKPDLKETDFNPYTVKQVWCGQDVGYQKGKQQAEAAVYQAFKNVSAVTVRVPYVTKTERLMYYCNSIVQQTPMNIDDVARGFTFIRDSEVGQFLPWIAAQPYEGPINLASTSFVTIKMILEYIEAKTGKKAIIDTVNGSESPFHMFGEKNFSMNMDKAEQLGYESSKLNDWFWSLMDEYIARAIKENANNNQVEVKKSESTIESIDFNKCSGCGACANICPKDAIKLVLNEEGFLMPQIDKNKCIDCGLCKKKCPTLGTQDYMKEHNSCYALMAQDELRMISSSGGAFTVLAEEIINQGGVVVGAAWIDDYNVEHVVAESINDLEKLRGSKYVQSNTAMTYRETKRFLENGRKVLYTGMPCQIDGLMHYLGKDYDNLVTIDVLCRGIVSNELFKKFINENYRGQKIDKISFKDKEPLGWGATTSYTFANGMVEKSNIHNSIWMYAYLANIMNRQSCYSCKFNTVKRVGDISIGDFWGIDKYDKTYNDKKGTSIVITSSKKGDDLVNSVKNKCKLLEKVPVEHGVPHNSALCSHVKSTPKRAMLYDNLKKMPFTAAVDRTTYGEKYKVGIVGWWYNLNYGGTLTYYSLNKSIQKMGYSVLMIRRGQWGATMPNDNTVPMRFAQKHYNVSRLYSVRDMHWLNYSCHAFVSGSDQLWNPYLQEYAGPEFFLSFVNDHNLKISYASSFGNVESVPEDFKEKHMPLLKRFNGVSVREDYAVDLCKNDFDMDVEHVCDPIFLCSAEEFKNAIQDTKIALPEKYTMNFMLDPNEDKVKAFKYVREKLGINESMNFTDLQNVEERVKGFCGEKVYGNAEIEEFINSYANADFVVTDSFHGTCLSIIFNKPFISIANKDRGEKRFVSLLKGLNLLDRLVFDIDEIYSKEELLKPIDYSVVNARVQELQAKGYEWLQGHLGKMI